MLTLLMLSGAFGRIIGGKLGDVIGALPGYILMSAGQTISVFWFPYLQSDAALYVLAIVFGFTYSGVMSSILVCTRTMVSPGYSGRAMSITSFFGWLGMGAGGFIGGLLFDATGNYEWSFSYAAIFGIINLILLLAFMQRIKGKTFLNTAAA
jgi:MFS family permease